MPNYRVSLSGLDFTDASILGGSINIVTSVDAPGAELVYDVFTVVVDFENGSCVLFSPADYDGILTEDLFLFGTADTITGDLTTTPYGTPINLYDGETLLAKFFVHDVVRVSKTHYKINAMSAIGFLENIQHMGGVYTNATVSEVVAEIVNGAFTYTIDPDAAAQKVSGWLPIDTAKNNLHKLLFAMGVSVTRDADGDVVFTFLNSENPSSVPEDRIYIGGNVDYNALATSVSVTEHSFYKRGGTQEEQIFSNVGGVAANHLFVAFQAPYYDVSSTDLTIHDVGDNYAIVSGVGTLTGKPYTHETNIYEMASSATGVVPNVVSSTEDTLVNSLNSPNVLARLAAYYGSRKTVSADIILDSEKAGDTISFTDAFGDEDTGIIVQMDTLVSSFAKARCKIVTDYTPTGQGNFYTQRELIDEDGTWAVPAGVTRIRIALIGGGGGAYGGQDGEEGAGGEDFYAIKDGTGTRTVGYRYGPQGASEPTQPVKHGGAGGQPGRPGKTYVADLTVTPGEIITVAVGAGGAGGTDHDTIGQDGTPTTASSTSIGSLSSDNGQASDEGYYDAFEGKAFATVGETGYAGGDGGQTDSIDLFGWSAGNGLAGGTVAVDYHGGTGGSGFTEEEGFRASGGGGGGAAYGANGEAGGNGTIELSESVEGGNGGKGADALPPSQAFYGCGGDGGNGGGAGGNAGGGYNKNNGSPPAQLYYGAKGAAGTGSVGGQGGDGCVIIYY